ncbi:MAG: zinc ribbon domain-containing protein [Actinobacteria bacterium]|jgi:putative FmdB family regulatory protein|nr:MAG: zinc ribbon domain-containing protein [Actinomycetota bacterium]
MPIYDYKCGSCGAVSELFVRDGDSSKARCPDCGSSDMHKLFSAFHTLSRGSDHTGSTCCGREERCAKPPCSDDGGCHKYNRR